MNEADMDAAEARLAALSDDALIAIWEAVQGNPTEEEVLALGEIERRNLDL